MFEYSVQPWRSLYMTIQVPILCIITIPWWIISNIPKSTRPRRSWSLKKIIFVNMSRWFFVLFTRIGKVTNYPSHEAIRPGKGIKGVWVNPIPQLILGEIKDAVEKNGVSSIKIPGYWMDKPELGYLEPGAAPAPGEKVIYCLHGGAYVTRSAHPSDPTANIPRGILKYCPTVTRSFSLEYRLSRTIPFEPFGGFPSALIDALAGYNHLIKDVGFDPKNIIIVGDSSGANLALALIRYLVEYAHHDPSNLLPPPPGALILLSAWTDMGTSHANDASMQKYIDIDYLPWRHKEFESYVVRAFTASLDMRLLDTCRYISPGSMNPALNDISFKGYPRTFIVAGGTESLLGQITTLKNKMQNELGDEHVVFFCSPDSVHDFICLRLEPERAQTLTKIAQWISTL